MSHRGAVFISATSRDLRNVRRHVSDLARQANFYPVDREGFAAESNSVSIADMLGLKLRGCRAVIHIAGQYYGEGPRRPSGKGRRSWTQMEYEQAAALGIETLVCLADDVFYARKHIKQRRDNAALQQAHCERLKSGAYHPFRRAGDLDRPVLSFLNRLTGARPRDKVKVLFVAAERGTGLRLRRQLRETRKMLAGHRAGTKIQIVPKFNATAAEIIAAIDRVQPTIVHLSGRQEEGKILLHDSRGRLASFDADELAELLATTRNKSLKLVVLDTCHCLRQAKELTRRGVPYAIGIKHAIADDVATEFYAAFYGRLGAGADLAGALAAASLLVKGHIQGNEAVRRELEEGLEMPFDPRKHIPVLVSARGRDPSREVIR